MAGHAISKKGRWVSVVRGKAEFFVSQSSRVRLLGNRPPVLETAGIMAKWPFWVVSVRTDILLYTLTLVTTPGFQVPAVWPVCLSCCPWQASNPPR